jgi:hypothetical protein
MLFGVKGLTHPTKYMHTAATEDKLHLACEGEGLKYVAV